MESKGYIGYKVGDIVDVSVEHLSKGSHAIIICACDYCGKELEMSYKTYVMEMNHTVIKKLACKACFGVKLRECNMTNYGVPSPMCLESIQEKSRNTTREHYGVDYAVQNPQKREEIKQTFISKYGVDHPQKSEQVRTKTKNTCLERYGVECTFQDAVTKQKCNSTILKRYGVDNISKSDTIKKKKQETLFKNYGVLYTMRSPELREKRSNTEYYNGTVTTSYQQYYLSKLYDMELNIPVKHYNVDMCDAETNLICEYDGSGHRLSVEFCEMSDAEFNQYEIIRNNIIKRAGYKMFRIISYKDKFPTDEKLIEMLNYVKTYFLEFPNHSWLEFNIDNGTVRNAENIQGISYDFGELHVLYKPKSIS